MTRAQQPVMTLEEMTGQVLYEEILEHWPTTQRTWPYLDSETQRMFQSIADAFLRRISTQPSQQEGQ